MPGARGRFGRLGPAHKQRRSVEQAELYFSVNKFLPEDSWGFHEADVADAASWGLARDHGPYDLTLCAGILHHLPDYREVLGWAARLTREALIIDTRVTRGEEKSVHEPDDTGVNSIEGRRDRGVPNLERLMEHLRGLGFVPQVLPVPFEEDAGVDGADNYAGGMRVAILATRH